jgi:hypothetical protein
MFFSNGSHFFKRHNPEAHWMVNVGVLPSDRSGGSIES